MLLDHPMVTGFTERLSDKTGIRRSTLSTWRLNRLRDPTWRPLRVRYSLRRRVLDDEQETQLAEFIATEYIDQGYLYTDADFRIDALAEDARSETQELIDALWFGESLLAAGHQ
jgi:hypothetical protein